MLHGQVHITVRKNILFSPAEPFSLYEAPCRGGDGVKVCTRLREQEEEVLEKDGEMRRRRRRRRREKWWRRGRGDDGSLEL